MNAIIRQKFDELVQRGKPLKESKDWGETADKRGHFAHFDLPQSVKASMFSHDNAGAFIVEGAIHRKYVELGYERGFLGYPVADEMALKNGANHYIGRISRFEGGAIVWCDSDDSIGVYRSDGTLVAGQSRGNAANHSTALAVPDQTTLQLEAMGKTVALLIETIALQQNQLVNLSEELNAATQLRLQTEISEQARKHIHGALDKAVATLKSTGGRGEVSVGATTHKGALRLVRNSEVMMQRNSTRDEALSNASSVEAKLKTAAAGLFNSGVGLNVDTQQTSALIEKASEKARHIRAEEAEGISNGGEAGTIAEVSPEERALLRWQVGDFEMAERILAASLRQTNTSVNLEAMQREIGSKLRPLVDLPSLAADAAFVDGLLDTPRTPELYGIFLRLLGFQVVAIS